jgi:hypothetical protein
MTSTPAPLKLAAFLGEWRAEGTSYGGTDQSGSDPCANGVPWTSTHTGRWHTGQFFLIQDERASPGGTTFDTLSIMGADESTGGYFVRSFENQGYYRHYNVSVDDNRWLLTGERERATRPSISATMSAPRLSAGSGSPTTYGLRCATASRRISTHPNRRQRLPPDVHRSAIRIASRRSTQ